MTEIKPHGRKQPLMGGDTFYGRQRRAVGLSQRQVEARTGIMRGVISQIERGRLIPTPAESDKLLSLYAEVQSTQSSD